MCLFFPICSLGTAQDVSVLAKYSNAISKIHTIKYSLQQIDTFSDGTIWNNRGKCLMNRDASDTLFGFEFWGFRNDLDGKEELYTGSQLFRIDHKNKSYRLRKDPDKGILGIPGGQMVVKEFFGYNSEYANVSTFKENEVLIVQFEYPDLPDYNVSHRLQKIYLDGKTYLPFKVINSSISFGKKNVFTSIISEIEINKTNFSVEIDGLNFLNLYKNVSNEGKERKQLVGNIAPDFTLNSFDGSIVTLKEYSGKVIILDFWETWCTPCIGSMPKLQALYEHYGNKGLVVIGIKGNSKNIDVAKQIIEKNKVTYSNVIADQKILQDYDILGVPRYIVIDEQGKIIYSYEGYNDLMKDLIAKKFYN